MRQAKKQGEIKNYNEDKTRSFRKDKEMENMIRAVDKDIFKNFEYIPYVCKDSGKYRHVKENYKDRNRHKLNFWS